MGRVARQVRCTSPAPRSSASSESSTWRCTSFPPPLRKEGPRSADMPLRTETNRTVDLAPALAESEKLISGSEFSSARPPKQAPASRAADYWSRRGAVTPESHDTGGRGPALLVARVSRRRRSQTRLARTPGAGAVIGARRSRGALGFFRIARIRDWVREHCAWLTPGDYSRPTRRGSKRGLWFRLA